MSNGYAFANAVIVDVRNPGAPVRVSSLVLFGGASWTERAFELSFQTSSPSMVAPTELQAYDVRSVAGPGKMGATPLPLGLERDADQQAGYTALVDENSLALVRMSLNTWVLPTQPWHLVAPGQEARLAFPAGAVGATTQVTYTPLLAPGHPTGNLASVGVSFQLNAEDLAGSSVTSFAQPVTVTVSYTAASLAGLIESELKLYRWSGVWQDAAESCAPASPYVRDTDQNRLSVRICQLSDFALMGSASTIEVQLPLLLKSHPLSYTLSGRVSLAGGAGLAGVTVETQAGHLAVTGADGSYSLPGVTAGSYTLTPSLVGYTFTPPNLAVSVPAQTSGLDFVAQPTMTCSEMLVNGNFEGSTGWTITGSTYPADYVTSPVHGGVRAMRSRHLESG